MPQSHSVGLAITEWLNYHGGDPTRDELALDAMEAMVDPTAQLTSAQSAALERSKFAYDPEHPGFLLDTESALVCCNVLRYFADSWIGCGYDIRKWNKRSELEGALRRRRPILVPGTPPSLHLEMARHDDPKKDGGGFGVWYFFRFITSPLFDRLGRCRTCGEYFIARRKRSQMTYCSSKCGRKATAQETMQRRRAAEHRARLIAVKVALRDYNNLPAARRAKIGSGWKRYVASAASKGLPRAVRHHPIRSAFITRALNIGELKLRSE